MSLDNEETQELAKIKEEPEEMEVKLEEEELPLIQRSGIGVKVEDQVSSPSPEPELKPVVPVIHIKEDPEEPGVKQEEERLPLKRKFSVMWDHFDVINGNRVKCRICKQQLSYCNQSTSTMLRHYRARHENEAVDITPQINPSVSTKDKDGVDDKIVNMIIKDCQPLSIVEDEGFRELMEFILPSYVLPTKQTLKAMINQKYEEKKETVRKDLENAAAVSLSADVWTSLNTEAYLAVTGHYINSDTHTKCTAVLGVDHFPQEHTAEDLAQTTEKILEEWAIEEKVKCLVTDAEAKMKACARMLPVRHTICIAHSLNSTVRKSCDKLETLTAIRNRSKQIAAYFRTSTTAKEKLEEVQLETDVPVKKLISELSTRWNSTYLMLERMMELKDAVLESLESLNSEITPLTTEDFEVIQETVRVLAPFHQATVELSEEKKVSGSKVIPMLKMLLHSLQRNADNVSTETATSLVENLKKGVSETICSLESSIAMAIPTLLDPRFKTMGFVSESKAKDAVKRLKSECTAEMRRSIEPAQTDDAQAGPSKQAAIPNSDDNLWQLLDMEVQDSRANSRATQDSFLEVKRYLSEVNSQRSQDPLHYWKSHKENYPHLYKLAMKHLCTPSLSVPSERALSKEGETVLKRRNRLGPTMLKQLMLLNKNV